jgi:hypothetical protein
MGHGHHHHGESVGNYFTEQLLTILVCGFFGLVAVLLYQSGTIGIVLAPQFHLWVLGGGAALLVLVLVRMVAVWHEAGEIKAQMAQANGPTCGINHVHGPDCDHDPNIPDDHDHDHGHSHDMSWVFVRMLVLAFPILLYFLGLPSKGYSEAEIERRLGKQAAISGASLKEMATDPETVEDEKKREKRGDTVIRVLKTKNKLEIRETVSKPGAEPVYTLLPRYGEGTPMRFNTLNEIAYDETKRQGIEGDIVILEGRLMKINDKEFTLYRMKMTCCATDQVPLKVRIIVPQALAGKRNHQWVSVKGQLQFFRGTDERGRVSVIPTLMVADITDIGDGNEANEFEH